MRRPRLSRAGIAIIAPMLTGKSSTPAEDAIDSDEIAGHDALVAKLGAPNTTRDKEWWARWNTERDHNLRLNWSQRPDTKWILLVHSASTAEALGLPVFAKVIIPEAEFRRRQDINPERAALARKNREGARQYAVRSFESLEAALLAARKEIAK